MNLKEHEDCSKALWRRFPTCRIADFQSACVSPALCSRNFQTRCRLQALRYSRLEVCATRPGFRKKFLHYFCTVSAPLLALFEKPPLDYQPLTKKIAPCKKEGCGTRATRLHDHRLLNTE